MTSGKVRFRRFSSSTQNGICFEVDTSRAERPIASAFTATAFSITVAIGTCLPRSCTVKPLFERIVFTRFLPMSCTSP